MKVWKKLQVVFLALLLCTGMMTQPALAASLLQDGIEAALTTDKETYQQGEEIKVTLTVTNTNDTAVTNLSLENVLPENFVLAENTETTKKMESLQAGETVTLTTVCTVKASDDKKDDENFCEELGDVLLQILLNCEIASERGAFDFSDVVQVLSDKMIRRHPHVFGDVKTPETPEEALELWREVKRVEKERKAEKEREQGK